MCTQTHTHTHTHLNPFHNLNQFLQSENKALPVHCIARTSDTITHSIIPNKAVPDNWASHQDTHQWMAMSRTHGWVNVPCVCVCARIHMCIRICTCVYVCVHTCMYVCISSNCVHACMQVHHVHKTRLGRPHSLWLTKARHNQPLHTNIILKTSTYI